ncbi:MAG: glycosyltransferase family 39 protein, partial [Gemmatimonadaceae bacterium]
MIFLRIVALLIALLGLVPMANFITTGAGLPWWPYAVRQWLPWGGALFALALVLGAIAPRRIESAFARLSSWLLAPSSRVFAVATGALASALSIYFGWRLFGHQPAVGDEFSQRFQALLLAHGRLTAATPDPVQFFSTNETLTLGGKWFAQFPMGGPVLLALGVLAGVPWLVNPLLGAVSIAAIYDFVRSTTDELTARVAALLAALCPTLFFMAGTQMNHTGTLALLWVALAALARWHVAESRRTSVGLAAVIGACVGVAAAIRPFDAFVVAALIGGFQLAVSRAHAWRTRSIVTECIAGAIPVALLLVANTMTTGSPFAFAYDVLNGPEHRPGFHATPLGFDHTPRRGLYMASAYLMKLDVALFAWPVPAMLLVVITLLVLRRASVWDRFCAALVVIFLAGYAAYWSESYFLGPRFLFIAAPVFVMYTARLAPAIRERVSWPWMRAGSLLVVPLMLVASWLVPVGGEMQFGTRRIASLYAARPGAAAVAHEVARLKLDHAVVFLAEDWRERLAARLRAVGVRPLRAEQLIKEADACTLQRALDAAEGMAPGAREQSVLDLVQADAATAPRPPEMTTARVSIVRDRPMTLECGDELSRSPPYMVSVDELLARLRVQRVANGDAQRNLCGLVAGVGAEGGVHRVVERG